MISSRFLCHQAANRPSRRNHQQPNLSLHSCSNQLNRHQPVSQLVSQPVNQAYQHSLRASLHPAQHLLNSNQHPNLRLQQHSSRLQLQPLRLVTVLYVRCRTKMLITLLVIKTVGMMMKLPPQNLRQSQHFHSICLPLNLSRLEQVLPLAQQVAPHH